MDFNRFNKAARLLLLIPLIVGLLFVIEQIVPLEKIASTVMSKHISERSRFGTKTYSIDFNNCNDQFTEDIYNSVQATDIVELEVLALSKEVRKIKLQKNGVVLENSTNEIYFQLGFATIFIAFSIYFLRKSYYTNKNYRYIVILCLISLMSLIRIITLNC